MEVFDEDKAVDFIKHALEDKGVETKYTSDDILEVIDIIWDYYEDNGFLDLDIDVAGDSTEEADKQALIDHVVKMIKKDSASKIAIRDIPAIVDAELAYEAECDEI